MWDVARGGDTLKIKRTSITRLKTIISCQIHTGLFHWNQKEPRLRDWKLRCVYRYILCFPSPWKSKEPRLRDWKHGNPTIVCLFPPSVRTWKSKRNLDYEIENAWKNARGRRNRSPRLENQKKPRLRDWKPSVPHSGEATRFRSWNQKETSITRLKTLGWWKYFVHRVSAWNQKNPRLRDWKQNFIMWLFLMKK